MLAVSKVYLLNQGRGIINIINIIYLDYLNKRKYYLINENYSCFIDFIFAIYL